MLGLDGIRFVLCYTNRSSYQHRHIRKSSGDVLQLHSRGLMGRGYPASRSTFVEGLFVLLAWNCMEGNGVAYRWNGLEWDNRYVRVDQAL